MPIQDPILVFAVLLLAILVAPLLADRLRIPDLILLIAFHLAFFWALKSGFAVKLVQQITQPIKAEIINEVLALIDQGLTHLQHRELVSTVEMSDLLLDVRTLLASEPASVN